MDYMILKRMKKTVFTLLLSLLIIGLHAQSKGVIFYKKTVDDERTQSPRVENYIIYFAGDRSIEMVQNLMAQVPALRTEANQTLQKLYIQGGKRKPFVYKDFSKRELMLADYIDFKLHLVKDTLANVKWRITKDTMRVSNYHCLKATTTFRGRDYVAWFTKDLPIHDGPWKFVGLPGLIVKINDIEKIYTYELQKVDLNNDFDTAIINVPEAYANDLPISQKAFIELYNQKVKELAAASYDSVFIGDNVSGSFKSTIPPKMERF